MHRWYRDLIHLRRKTLSLNLGDPMRMDVFSSEEGRWIYTDRGDIRTVINFADALTPFPMPPHSELLLSSDAAPDRVDGGILVPHMSMAIYHIPPRATLAEPPQ